MFSILHIVFSVLAVCVVGNVVGNQSNKGFKQGNFLTAKPEQDTTKLLWIIIYKSKKINCETY